MTSVTSLPFLCFHMILCLRYMHILLEKMTSETNMPGVTKYTLRFLKGNKILFLSFHAVDNYISDT